MGLLFVGIGIGLLIAGGMAIFRAVTSSGNEHGGHHDPLRVTVERTGREPWAVAFRDDAPLVPALADLATREHVASYGVLREHGGIDFGETDLRLTLHGHGEEEVIVRAISVVVVRRDPPFTGRLIGVDAPAPQRLSRALVYDLDADEPARELGPRNVDRDEPLEVIVVGTTTSAYCQWRIHIDTEVGGEERRMTVGDRDLPFQTTGCDRSEFPSGFESIA